MLAFRRKGLGACARAIVVFAAIVAPVLVPLQADAGGSRPSGYEAKHHRGAANEPTPTATGSPVPSSTAESSAAAVPADPSPSPTPAESTTPVARTEAPSPSPSPAPPHSPTAPAIESAPAENADTPAAPTADATVGGTQAASPTATPTASATSATATPPGSATPSPSATATTPAPSDPTPAPASDDATPPDTHEEEDESPPDSEDRTLSSHYDRHPHEHEAPPRQYPQYPRDSLLRKLAAIGQQLSIGWTNTSSVGGAQWNTQVASNSAAVQQTCIYSLCSNRAIIGQQNVLEAGNIAGLDAAQVNTAGSVGSQSNTQVSSNDAYVAQICIDWCVNYTFIYQGDFLTGANLAAANAAAELAQANTQVSANTAHVEQYCNTNCANIAIILQSSIQLALNAVASVAEDVSVATVPAAAGAGSQSNTQVALNTANVVQGCAGVCWNTVIVWQGTVQEALNVISPPGQV